MVTANQGANIRLINRLTLSLISVSLDSHVCSEGDGGAVAKKIKMRQCFIFRSFLPLFHFLIV